MNVKYQNAKQTMIPVFMTISSNAVSTVLYQSVLENIALGKKQM